MISEQDKARVHNFIFSAEYRIIDQIAHDLIADVRGRSNVADTEWETLKNVLLAEGEERGIQRLLQRLNELAS